MTSNSQLKSSARFVGACVAAVVLGVVLCFSWAGMARAASLPLDEILRQSGKVVERFWAQFPEVNCQEQVLQTKLDKNDKIVYEQESLYDYLVLVEMTAEEMGVTESRLLQKQDGKSKNMPMLVTDGFSMMVLVFHPYYQGSFEYEQLPEQLVEGKYLLRVHFRHVKGTRSPSALQVRGRDYPLDWEGTAWIDPDTSVIRRIQADLMAPMDDIGLQVLHCVVQYGPVHFNSTPETYWLPQSAEIEAETPRQRWRNVHRFTSYKRFSTDAKEVTQQPRP